MGIEGILIFIIFMFINIMGFIIRKLLPSIINFLVIFLSWYFNYWSIEFTMLMFLTNFFIMGGIVLRSD